MIRRHRLPVRVGLVVVALPQLIAGLWALLAPHSFYRDFPGAGHHWVSVLGPYDAHLVSDVGGGLTALAVLLLIAALLLDRNVVIVGLTVWLIFAVSHFVYHVSHGADLPTADNTANLIVLGLAVAVPVALLVLLWTDRPQVGKGRGANSAGHGQR